MTSRVRSRNNSSLNQPIQFRQVVMTRQDHQPASLQNKSSLDKYFSQSRNNSKLSSYMIKNQQKSIVNINFKNDSKSLYDVDLSSRLEKQKVNKIQRTTQERNLQNLNVSTNKMIIKKYKTQSIMNNQNQQDQVKQDKKVILSKLNQLQSRLQNLVDKRLQLLINKVNGSSNKIQQKRIQKELQNITKQISFFRQDKYCLNDQTNINIINKKINLIQTLLAKHITQAQLIKKNHLGFVAQKNKGKIGNFDHFPSKIHEVHKRINSQPPFQYLSPQKNKITKPLFDQSTNKKSFLKPQLSDYQKFRYKHNQPMINHQPLPRSSYKRQYLFMNFPTQISIIKKDHYPYSPNNKQVMSSIYGQDYKSLRTQIMNYQDLDAYRDKIKTLKISYMPKNKKQMQTKQAKQYNQRVKSQTKGVKLQHYNQNIILSEAHRQYKGENWIQPSKIKHKQLKDLQYKFKGIYKS